FLDYRDSGVTGSVDNSHPNSLVQAPREEVVGKIVYLIRRFQPQIVLTFDPVGGYFHSDHIAIHRATTEAFRLAGDPCRYPEHLDQNLRPFQPQKLYYTAVSRRLLKIIVALMPLLGMDPTAFGRNKDVNLKRVAEAEQIITTSLDIRSYLHTRIKASACYRSQGSGRFLGPRWIQRWFFSKESYTRAVPPVNGEGKMPVESDFFE
ncbi:MAG: PIG-L family deacetylase, partial [Candidatus Binatia bacterium]|nr:PIG-L family deacetylase [Candidatus Binatia bacterium]